MNNTIGGPGTAFRDEVDREAMKICGDSAAVGALQRESMEVSALTGAGFLATTEQQGSESRGRSFLKAVSWRVTALVITVSVVWVGTGEVTFAAAVGVVDAALKIGLYYFHERAWNRSSFGRIRRWGRDGDKSKRE